MNQAGGEPAYVISAEEILWGIILVAMTMIIHGIGMILTLYASRSFADQFGKSRSMLSSPLTKSGLADSLRA
jgi:hypothetical protein